MARDLQIGENVWVPRSRVGLDQTSSSFFYTEILETVDRSVIVGLPNGKVKLVASSCVLRHLGVMIARIGDFRTEIDLLDPLAKSILQYFRLLLSDDQILYAGIRSFKELKILWESSGAAYPYLVLIGHGSSNSMHFGVEGAVDATEFSSLFGSTDHFVSCVLSLCCKTGRADFAKPLSKSSGCRSVIAPQKSIHGALASQFTQLFFTHHLLDGLTKKVAYTRAKKEISGSGTFKYWENGESS